MNVKTQKWLAIGSAVLLVAMLFAYKGYIVSVAISSQSACVVTETATGTPARRSC